MIAYLYDPDTSAYLGQSVDAANAPANSTLEVPPFTPDPAKQWAVWRDGAWHIEDRPPPPPFVPIPPPEM